MEDAREHQLIFCSPFSPPPSSSIPCSAPWPLDCSLERDICIRCAAASSKSMFVHTYTYKGSQLFIPHSVFSVTGSAPVICSRSSFSRSMASKVNETLAGGAGRIINNSTETYIVKDGKKMMRKERVIQGGISRHCFLFKLLRIN